MCSYQLENSVLDQFSQDQSTARFPEGYSLEKQLNIIVEYGKK